VSSQTTKALQQRGELVFPSASGTPLRNRNWRRDVFDPAVEAQGLEITPHNLRDTAASLAIQEGASVVGRRLVASRINPVTEQTGSGTCLGHGRLRCADMSLRSHRSSDHKRALTDPAGADRPAPVLDSRRPGPERAHSRQCLLGKAPIRRFSFRETLLLNRQGGLGTLHDPLGVTP
jgi:hypothetical protein